MIDAIVAGKLFGSPEAKTAKTGRPFTTAKVRATTAESESIFINVIAFSDTAQAALYALGDGDAVSLAGAITPKAWTDRNGNVRPALDMVATQVMTAYTVNRKRAAQQHSQDGEQQRASRDSHRPADEAWQARTAAPTGHVHPDYGLDF